MGYHPVDLKLPIELTGMEYFGSEQHDLDMATIAVDQTNPLQILGKYTGDWGGELDDAIKTAATVLYADRPFHKDYLYEVYDLSICPTIAKMPEALGFVKGQHGAQIQMQRPGSIMSRHVDPPEIFTMVSEESRHRAVRVLVMLTPWEHGQLMGFNNSIWKNWEAGTIIYCDFLKVSHFTANCSWHSRPILQISGLANDQLWELINTKQSRTIDL